MTSPSELSATTMEVPLTSAPASQASQEMGDRAGVGERREC